MYTGHSFLFLVGLCADYVRDLSVCAEVNMIKHAYTQRAPNRGPLKHPITLYIYIYIHMDIIYIYIYIYYCYYYYYYYCYYYYYYYYYYW